MPLILFLDIDGVMNSADWWRRRPPTPEGLSDSSDGAGNRDRWVRRNIDPVAVGRLERIRVETACHFVLSSSWRAMLPLVVMNHYLREVGGFNGLLVGATPEIDNGIGPLPIRNPDRPPGLWSRGEEIQIWLDVWPAGVVTSYVILDDDEIPGHAGHFIRTDFEVGLTDANADRAIEILRGRA